MLLFNLSFLLMFLESDILLFTSLSGRGILQKKNLKIKNFRFLKKNYFLYIVCVNLWVPSKNVSQYGPHVWPAIANMCTYKYIY